MAPQVGALETMYAEVKCQDRTVFPAWPVGAEAPAANGPSGPDPWTIRDDGPTQGMYYEAVHERIGAGTSDFFRLFMVPGMLHCGDGVGTGQFDTLGALSAWVESDEAGVSPAPGPDPRS